MFLHHLGVATVDFEFQVDLHAQYGVCELLLLRTHADPLATGPRNDHDNMFRVAQVHTQNRTTTIPFTVCALLLVLLLMMMTMMILLMVIMLTRRISCASAVLHQKFQFWLEVCLLPVAIYLLVLLLG